MCDELFDFNDKGTSQVLRRLSKKLIYVLLVFRRRWSHNRYKQTIQICTDSDHILSQIRTTYYHRFGPHTITDSDHILSQIRTTYYHRFGPHTITDSDHILSQIRTTYYHRFGPHTITDSDHILSQIRTTYYHRFGPHTIAEVNETWK